MTKLGTGTLALGAANTYRGDTYVEGGVLRLDNLAGASTGTIHAIDPTIVFNAVGTNNNPISLESADTTNDPTILQNTSGGTVTLAGAITEAAANSTNAMGGTVAANQPVQFTGAGTTVLTNTANNWTGVTTVASGATLQGTSATLSGGSITDNGTVIYNQVTNGTVAQVISGSGALVKQGAGALTLTQSNSYSGGTTISAGRLIETNNGAALGSGTVAISSAATLELNGSFNQNGITFTGTGTIQTTGSAGDNIAFGNGGNVNISLSAGGLIDVQGGTLNGSASGQGIWTNNFASLNIASGATFDTVEGAVQVDALTGAGTLQGGFGGTVTMTIGDANGSGAFSGVIQDNTNFANRFLAITKVGTGTETLSGVNTYTGATTISGGVLALTGAGSIANSASVTDNASLDISGASGAVSVNQLTGTGGVVLGANTLTAVNTIDGTLSGAITDAGAGGGFTKDGSANLILSGANSYTGVTTIAAGTLTGTTASISGASIVDNGTLAYNQTGSGTAAQNISGTGGVTVSGLGSANSLTFSGAQTETGNLSITDASSVTLTGSYAGGGTVTTTGGVFTNLGSIATSTNEGFIPTAGGTINNGSASVTNASLVGGASGINEGNGAGALSVNNYGLIQGSQYEGVTYRGSSGLTVTNYGTGVIYAQGGSESSAWAVGNDQGTSAISVTNNTGGQIVGRGYGVFGTAAGDNITNAGTIASGLYSGAVGSSAITVGGNYGVYLGAGGSVTNQAGGLIEGGAAGLYSAGALTLNNNAGSTVTGATSGVFAASGSTINNAGTISNTSTTNDVNHAALILAATTTTVVNNTGTISGAEQGIVAKGGGRLNNSGTISGADVGNSVYVVSSANPFLIANSGTITGSFTTGSAFWGVSFVGSGDTLVNTGTVHGDEAVRLQASGIVVNGSTGTISGATYGLQTSGANGVLTLTNYGAITGGGSILGTGANNVSLLAGSSVTGALTFGTGNDTINLYTGSVTSADVVDATTGLTLQTAGTHAAASFGAIALGAGTNVLNLMGAGDGTAGNGASGALNLANLSGATIINKSGTGVFALSGADASPAATINAGTGGAPGSGGLLTFATTGLTGAINVNGAKIQALTAGAFGTGVITLIDPTVEYSANGTYANNIVLQTSSTADPNRLQVDAGITATLSGNITTGSGAGVLAAQPVVFDGGGTAILTGTNAWSGTTTISNGSSLSIGAVANIGTGTLLLGDATTSGTLITTNAGAVTLANALTLGAGGSSVNVSNAAGNTTLSAAITGADLTKTGAGTLTLTGANTYTGTTTINAGTLAVSGGQAIADAGAVQVNAGGTLALLNSERVGTLNGSGAVSLAANTLFLGTNNGSSTYSGVASGTGGITQTGTGVLTLSGANTYTGTTLVNGGGFVLGASDVLADASTLNLTNATGNIGAYSDTITTLFLTNSTLNGTTGVLTSQSYDLTNATLNAQTGTGYLYTGLSNTNSILNGVSGAANVEASGGTLTLGASNLLSDTANVVVDTGSILDLGANSDTVGSLTLQGTLNGTGTLTAGTYSSVAGTINANLGTGTLTASKNVFTGATVTTLNGSANVGAVQVFNGATLTLGASNRIADTANVSVLSGGTFDLGAFSDTVGTLSLSGTLNGSGTLLATNFTLAGGTANAVLGGGSLNATTGVSTLNAANTYTGATTIALGATLALGANGSIASSSGVADSGTFDISAHSGAVAIAGLSGAGGVTLGANTLTLNGGGTYAGVASGSGGLTVTSGSETLTGNNTYTGATTISAGNLTLGAGGTTGSVAGTIALNAGILTINRSNAVSLASISGGGSLVQAGTGTTTLTGINTYTGSTTINAGSLALVANSSIAASSGVTDNATFDISGHTGGTSIAGLSGVGSVILGANTLTLTNGGAFAGTASGTGGLTVLAGNEILTGNNIYTGATTVSGGNLTLGVGGTTGSVAGAIALNSGVLTINRSDAVSLASISGGGSLVQAGTGTTTLTGINNYTGSTTINAGSLALVANSSIAASSGVTDNATFDISGHTGGTSIAGLYGVGGVTLGANTLTLTNGGAFAGTASGTGGLTVLAGNEILTGNNTYTGATTVSGGNLTLGVGGTTGSVAGAIALNSGVLTINRSNAVTLGGAISGGGSLVQAGTGVTTLLAANGYTGSTTINAGTLALGASGSIAASSSIIDNAAFDISDHTGAANITSLSGNGVVVLGANTLVVTNAAGNFSGVVSGSGGLTLSGGAEILTGSNTYTGATTITGASLALNGAGSIAASSGVANAGLFDISGHTGGASIASLSGTGVVSLGANTLTLANATGTFSGTMSGAGGFTLAAGTETLTGSNTYIGLTTISGGVLQLGGGGSTLSNTSAVSVASGGTLGLLDNEQIGSLAGAGAVVLGSNMLFTGINNASTTFSGLLSGAGGMVKTGTGAFTLTQANTYTGVTGVIGGTLVLAGGGATLSKASDVVVTTPGILALADNETIASLAGTGAVALGANTLTTGADNASTTFSGAISGTGALIKTGTGSFLLSGTNTYIGATTINGGMLAVSGGSAISDASDVTVATGAGLYLMANETIGSLAGAGQVNTNANTLTVGADNASTTYSGNLFGTGNFVKTGSGTMFVTGASSFSGTVQAAGGILSINGALPNAAVSILSGATLKGSGLIGSLNVGAGSIVAPGNSIGTLMVSGALAFAPTSTYQAEVNAAGASDLIMVGGKATLAGTVQVIAAPGTYARQTYYTILTAAGGVSGTFNAASTNFAFLTPTLVYGANSVTLQLSNNGIAFQTLATTPNQVGVATALYASSPNSRLYNAILVQTDAGARQAFNALNGEIYPTISGVLFDNSRYVRDAVLSHMAGGDGTQQSGRISDDALQLSVWAQGLATNGRTASQGGGNVASSQENTSAVILGADAQLGRWRVGGVVGQSTTDLSVGALNSSTDIRSSHAGIYAGGPVYAGLNLELGYDHGWHDLQTTRRVIFPGFSEQSGASSHANTDEAYGELNYNARFKSVTLQPYASLAYVKNVADAFSEAGGISSLTGKRDQLDGVFSEAGLRISSRWQVSATTWISPYASLGWRHVFGAAKTDASYTFASTGTSFFTQGAALDRDALKLNLGAAVDLTRGVKLSVGYAGEISDSWQDHQAKAQLTVRF